MQAPSLKIQIAESAAVVLCTNSLSRKQVLLF